MAPPEPTSRRPHRRVWRALGALLAAGMTAAVIAAPSTDDALEPVRAQLRLKRFAAAAALLQPLANRGDAEAEQLLANLYLNGLGVSADRQQAQDWLTRAAHHGNTAAMYGLAVLLSRQTAADHAESQQWLQRAAQAGHPLAQIAVRDGIRPQRYQPDQALTDPAVRRAAYLSAAAADDWLQLQAFNDRALITASDDFGRTALAYAARYGAPHSAAWLLDAGAAVDHADQFGITPLMLAADRGDATLVQTLLAHRARPELQDAAGNNALIHAIRSGAAAIALLLPVSELRQRNSQGWSALDWAMHLNQPTLSQQLRAQGLEAIHKAPVQSGKPVVPIQHAASGDLYRGWSDVLIAATRGDAALFNALSAANAAALRGQEAAALLTAVQADNPAVIDTLMQRGAGIDTAAAETPLSWAVRHGRTAVAQQLLSKGIKPDLHGTLERAPLLDAVRSAGESALALTDALVKAGARIDARDAQGRTAVMISAQLNRVDLIERLQQSGADLNAVDKSGSSALMLASRVGNDECVRALLALHASVELRDAQGNHALNVAAANSRTSSVERLLAAGSSLQANARGDNPLLLAAAKAPESLVRRLLAAGIAVDAHNHHGDTALIIAARAGNLGAVRALLAAGADVSLRNDDRATAKDVADKLAFGEISAALASRS